MIFIPIFNLFITLFYNSNLFSQETVISLPVEKISFFELGAQGEYIQKKGKPFKGQRETYTIQAKFSSKDTALLVIDPWDNMPSRDLNQSNTKIINQFIVPLVIKASKAGFPVYIFTQDCKRMPAIYSCSVPQSLLKLQYQYSTIKIYYWDDYYNPNKAKRLLNKNGIHHLIYTGFSSNMCIINRPAGIVAMQLLGFSTYFVPETSSAIEINSTKKDKSIHKAMEIIIAQSLGKIIHYNTLVDRLNKVNTGAS